MNVSAPESSFVTANGVRLHYLDWGGSGQALLFIPGMGCSAYIFDRFAQRFTDAFHVLALTRRGHGDSDYPDSGYDVNTLTEDLRQFLDALGIEQVILAGHSMGFLELSRFAERYSQRVLKLIYLDAAYDRCDPQDQAILTQNPAPAMMPDWPPEGVRSMPECVVTIRRLYPSLDAIWGSVMDEEVRHNVYQTPEGKIEDKMSDAIGQALAQTMRTYRPDYAAPAVPILSFFCIPDGEYFLSDEYMSEGQKTQVREYFQNVRGPHQQRYAESFRDKVPQAEVVIIPHGHHYCFLKHADVVYAHMRKFLLAETESPVS